MRNRLCQLSLRFGDFQCIGSVGQQALDVHESRWTSHAPRLRITTNFLKALAQERNVDLGRARLLRLPPGHRIHPHIDQGDYHLFRDRYHLILQAPAGLWLQCGDEQVEMREGELWWFNNKAPHEVHNNNAIDCVLLAFDALNADGKRLLAQVVRIRARREGLQAPAPF